MMTSKLYVVGKTPEGDEVFYSNTEKFFLYDTKKNSWCFLCNLRDKCTLKGQYDYSSEMNELRHAAIRRGYKWRRS